jgi:hypothetical protein
MRSAMPAANAKTACDLGERSVGQNMWSMRISEDLIVASPEQQIATYVPTAT